MLPQRSGTSTCSAWRRRLVAVCRARGCACELAGGSLSWGRAACTSTAVLGHVFVSCWVGEVAEEACPSGSGRDCCQAERER
jgi:hypothetical protein